VTDELGSVDRLLVFGVGLLATRISCKLGQVLLNRLLVLLLFSLLLSSQAILPNVKGTLLFGLCELFLIDLALHVCQDFTHTMDGLFRLLGLHIIDLCHQVLELEGALRFLSFGLFLTGGHGLGFGWRADGGAFRILRVVLFVYAAWMQY
jgi:hypothetical protein